jgi:hypothetical protein
MDVSRKQLADLLVVLGHDTANSWSVQELQNKLNENGILYYQTTPVFPPHGNRDLFVLILKNQSEGKEVRVVDSERPLKTHTKRGRRVSVGRDPTLTWREKLDQWKRKPVPVTDRGAGITRCVIGELKKAGAAGNSITKEYIVGVLKKKFPNPLKKMKTTVDNLLGSRLAQQYGIEVSKTKRGEVDGKRGYWINPEAEK